LIAHAYASVMTAPVGLPTGHAGAHLEFLPPVDGIVKELAITIVEGDLKGVRIK
jgi:hypothetical protein